MAIKARAREADFRPPPLASFVDSSVSFLVLSATDQDRAQYLDAGALRHVHRPVHMLVEHIRTRLYEKQVVIANLVRRPQLRLERLLVQLLLVERVVPVAEDLQDDDRRLV